MSPHKGVAMEPIDKRFQRGSMAHVKMPPAADVEEPTDQPMTCVLSGVSALWPQTVANTEGYDYSSGSNSLSLSKVHDWIDERSQLCLLQPEESFAFSFICNSSNMGPSTNKLIGYPVIKWCTSMGEFSLFKGDEVSVKGAASDSQHIASGQILSSPSRFPLKASCLDCPSIVNMHDRFTVSVRVTNTGTSAISAKLLCSNNPNPPGSKDEISSIPVVTSGSTNPTVSQLSGTSGNAGTAVLGLCVTGITQFNLGNIEAGYHVDLVLNVFALNSGLHNLESIYLVDNATNVSYCCSSLLQKIFVTDEVYTLPPHV